MRKEWPFTTNALETAQIIEGFHPNTLDGGEITTSVAATSLAVRKNNDINLEEMEQSARSRLSEIAKNEIPLKGNPRIMPPGFWEPI